MKPASYTLDLYRGDSGHWQFTCWADAAKTIPAVLDGATAAAEIRRGTLLAAKLTCAIEGNVIDARLAADDCATLPPSGLTWDLELTFATGDVQTPVAGPVLVQGDVTAA